MKYLFLILILLTTGCAVMPPDEPVCVEMSMTRGECINPMSGKTFTVDEFNLLDGKTWWQMRPTNIIFPFKTYAAWKKFTIKLCKKNKKMCDKEVANWERSFDNVDNNLKEKGTMP